MTWERRDKLIHNLAIDFIPILSIPATWGLIGVALTAFVGFYSAKWKTNREEQFAKKREEIAIATAVKAAEIVAQNSAEERTVHTLEDQIRELRTELAAQKADSDKDMLELKASYHALNIEFDEERKKRREWETVAEQNLRKIEDLSEKLIRMENEGRVPVGSAEKTK